VKRTIIIVGSVVTVALVGVIVTLVLVLGELQRQDEQSAYEDCMSRLGYEVDANAAESGYTIEGLAGAAAHCIDEP
jgi:hypothetical protein